MSAEDALPSVSTMSDIPAVSRDEIARAERRFMRFFIALCALSAALAAAMTMDVPDRFWDGNRLFSIGSLLFLASMVRFRYFDVRRTADPNFRTIDRNAFDPIVARLEHLVDILWIAGSALFVASRWSHW